MDKARGKGPARGGVGDEPMGLNKYYFAAGRFAPLGLIYLLLLAATCFFPVKIASFWSGCVTRELYSSSAEQSLLLLSSLAVSSAKLDPLPSSRKQRDKSRHKNKLEIARLKIWED